MQQLCGKQAAHRQIVCFRERAHLKLHSQSAKSQQEGRKRQPRSARQRQLDITLDNLRARYGKNCVLRGRACFDPALGLVQREEHAFLRK